MKKSFVKFLLLAICLGIFVNAADAQKKVAPRKSTKRASTSKTAKGKTKAKIKPTVAVTDTVKNVVAVAAPVVVNDSIPIKMVKKSLRPDEAVETSSLRDRTPLPYENLRADDALFRHKVFPVAISIAVMYLSGATIYTTPSCVTGMQEAGE